MYVTTVSPFEFLVIRIFHKSGVQLDSLSGVQEKCYGGVMKSYIGPHARYILLMEK